MCIAQFVTKHEHFCHFTALWLEYELFQPFNISSNDNGIIVEQPTLAKLVLGNFRGPFWFLLPNWWGFNTPCCMPHPLNGRGFMLLHECYAYKISWPHESCKTVVTLWQGNAFHITNLLSGESTIECWTPQKWPMVWHCCLLICELLHMLQVFMHVCHVCL